MNNSKISLATFALAGGLCAGAFAQTAGETTTIGVNITESTQIALGWSVKNTLMGKTIYNQAGEKVGKVDDLIVSPDRKVAYVIVGAGGFIGIGRHDVAIPVNQIQDTNGKLVMPNATKDTIKSMPVFTYATDTTRRDAFIAAADKDVEKGRAKIVDLEKKASIAASETKAKINLEVTALKANVKAAETKLGDMRRSAAARWRDFEVDVNSATSRLRKSIETATG
jgi:sporulation protein YlmC with PRC-barrel domain